MEVIGIIFLVLFFIVGLAVASISDSMKKVIQSLDSIGEKLDRIASGKQAGA
jgi:hypothetical protein